MAFFLFATRGVEPGAVGEHTAVLAFAAFEWTRNANEFRFDCVAGGANNGIAVTAHVDEGKVRRQVGVRLGASRREVTAPGVLKTRAHSMVKQHVHGGLRGAIVRCLTNVESAKRVVCGQEVLEGFDQTGRRD